MGEPRQAGASKYAAFIFFNIVPGWTIYILHGSVKNHRVLRSFLVPLSTTYYKQAISLFILPSLRKGSGFHGLLGKSYDTNSNVQ